MKLKIQNFAQIKNVELDVGKAGDLTFVVGPQATGKSLALQWLKLACDRLVVRDDLERFGFAWSDSQEFFGLFFGEGMQQGYVAGSSSAATSVHLDGKPLPLSTIGQKRRGRSLETTTLAYYVPAHRSLLLADGWPKLFQQYSADTPYIARVASESLNALLLRISTQSAVFPQTNRLQASLRTAIDNAVFHGNKLKNDTSQSKRRLVLETKNGAKIPFMAWTAGQREFVPLMLALYELMPPAKVSRLDKYETVILEEPELGLHPQAIMAVMTLALHLLHRGYRVVISTHSPLLLECAWALQRFKRSSIASTQARKAFALPNAPDETAESAVSANVRAYYFDYASDGLVTSRDISALNLFDESPDVAGWGGLSSYSANLGNYVAEAVTKTVA
jgi:hypothetical protein